MEYKSYDTIDSIFASWNETKLTRSSQHWRGCYKDELSFALKRSLPDFREKKQQLFIQQIFLKKYELLFELELVERAGLCKEFCFNLFKYCPDNTEIILECVNTPFLKKFCETRGFTIYGQPEARCWLVKYEAETDEEQKIAVQKSKNVC